MKNQTTFNVTIGTPNSDGFTWSHVKKDMTINEYLETRSNLSGSLCTIRGPIEWYFENGAERRKRVLKKKKDAAKQRIIWAQAARKRNSK